MPGKEKAFSSVSEATNLSQEGFIVDEVSKGHHRGPHVILVIDAAAMALLLLPLGHHKLVSDQELQESDVGKKQSFTNPLGSYSETIFHPLST